MSEVTAPDALLLIAPGCVHCPAVLDGLTALVKQGKLGRLEVINSSVHPETVQALGIRSVPWTRIGDIELEGAHSPGELALWTQRAASPEGYGLYLNQLLERGHLERVLGLIRQVPQRLPILLGLLVSLETPMAVRIGVGAVMEELAGSDVLQPAIAPLRELLGATEPQIRADACHYLGLCGDPEAVQAITPLLDDANAEVREIARETLDVLGGPSFHKTTHT